MSISDLQTEEIAADSTWRLSTEDRVPWLRAYLGNGLLSAQLVAEGGLADEMARPLHLMAGLYDRADGREVEHPVPLPAWNALRLSVAGVPLAHGAAHGYVQDLDLFRGLAETTHRWTRAIGEIAATTLQAVLRQEPNMAVIRVSLVADHACTVQVAAEVDATSRFAVRESIADAGEDAAWVTARTQERDIPLVVAGSLWSGDMRATYRPGIATIDVALEANREVTVVWLVAVHSARTAHDPLAAARHDLERGRSHGPVRLLDEHIAAWAALWRADVIVEGDAEVQRFVRAGLFALLCSSRADVPASIAPMGLSSLGYNGHIFWDADIWMFPPLLLLHQDLALGMLTYRQQRMPAARARAKSEGYAGAMFPWESATNGDETTPSFARTGLKEQHITACVAVAQWQYFLVTGDTIWLAEQAWPVLDAAAQFWVSRVVHTARGYEILDVIAADEYAEDIDNNAFTNGVVRVTLFAAARAARLLGRIPPPEWEMVAQGLILLYDGDLVLEFDGYDGRVIKQADVELLTFPLELPLSEATIACNLATYRAVTDPEGPAMSRAISAIVAAQLGQRDEARALFLSSYVPHLWGPFYSLAETISNGEVNFLTGVGGALQTLLFGFAGLRLHEGALALDPLLPAGWEALRFPALCWRDGTISLAILPGDRAELAFTAGVLAGTLVLYRWRPGPSPLRVELRSEQADAVRLEAPGWHIAHEAANRVWLLTPAEHGEMGPFARLTFTLDEGGVQGSFTVDQRVRNGDNRS